MPLLNDGRSAATAAEIPDSGTPRFFPACANPHCTSGWFHLWRNRQVPLIEGRWTCSPNCARSRIEAIVRREMNGPGRPSGVHRHRIPIGLVLLAEGWISHEQLKKALEAQRKAKRFGNAAGGARKPRHGMNGRSCFGRGRRNRLVAHAPVFPLSTGPLSAGSSKSSSEASINCNL